MGLTGSREVAIISSRGRTLAGLGRISFHSQKASRWQAITSR